MLKKAFLIAGLLLMLVPSAALAHGGHGEVAHSEHLQVGKYGVTIEYAEWPLKANKGTQFVVVPDGGAEGMTGRWTLIPAPGVKSSKLSNRFELYPGIDDAFTVQLAGLAGPGNWEWEIELDGPEGKFTAHSSTFAVGDPPTFPLWLGWLLGLAPVWGLLWWIGREAVRVRKLIRLDGGANA